MMFFLLILMVGAEVVHLLVGGEVGHNCCCCCCCYCYSHLYQHEQKQHSDDVGGAVESDTGADADDAPKTTMM